MSADEWTPPEMTVGQLRDALAWVDPALKVNMESHCCQDWLGEVSVSEGYVSLIPATQVRNPHICKHCGAEDEHPSTECPYSPHNRKRTP